MAVVAELIEAEELIRDHPEFQAAMRRRGVTDFETVQVDAWPAGHFGRPGGVRAAAGARRRLRPPAPGDNEWAHPVDGVIALVDLNRLEVLRVDDHGVVPIPPETGNFDAEAGGAAARRPQAARDHPARGPELHASTAASCAGSAGSCTSASRPARGSSCTASATEDGGRLRSILHRASLSEMVVPYGDPSPTHYFKNAFDAGENGVGVAASPLTRGCDCLGEIRYLDAVVSDADGAPVHDPERDLHARGGHGRALAPHRVARRRRARCAARGGS